MQKDQLRINNHPTIVYLRRIFSPPGQRKADRQAAFDVSDSSCPPFATSVHIVRPLALEYWKFWAPAVAATEALTLIPVVLSKPEGPWSLDSFR
jgi:hypothetical protein